MVTISANASTPGNDVTFVADLDQSGAIDSGEHIGTVSSDSSTGEASVEFDPATVSQGNGDYTVYAIEEGNQDNTDDTSYSISNPSEYYDQSATLTVDDSSPVAENPSPTGTISTTTPQITVDLTEDVSSINTSSIEVRIQQTDTNPNEELFYRLDATKAQGISFSDGTLTIDITESKLSALPEGDIQVSVEASDEAGNPLGTNPTTFSFTIDTNPVGASFTDNGAGAGDTPDDGAVLTSNNPTIGATITNGSANITSAEVTISGDGYSQTLTAEDSVYDSAAQTFSINVGSEGDVAPLPDGEVTITVSATDEDGKSDSETRTFSVDTSAPSVQSISVNDGDLVNTNNAGSVPVEITFNETVQPSTVSGSIYIDAADGAEVTLGSAADVSPNEGVASQTVTYTVNLNSGGNVATTFENASAEVQFGSATDSTGVNTNDSLAVNKSFAIDTITPTVNVEEDAPPTTVSGVVDFAGGFSASNADGGELNFYVQPGQSGAYVPLDEIDTLSDFDTSALPEGTHNYKVNITDDADNTGTTGPITIHVDNEDPSVSYVGNSDTLTGQVDISEVLSVDANGTESVTFGYTQNPTDGSVGFTTAESINVNDLGTGTYVLAAQVDDPGYNGDPNTVVLTHEIQGESLQDNTVDIAANENANDAGLVNVTVTSDVDLSAFNVSVVNNDNYHEGVSGIANESDFVQNETSTESGDYEYTAVFHAPRDGAYTFELEDASLGSQSMEFGDGVKTADQVVDNLTPSLVDADLTGADESSMSVQLEFSEPIQTISSFEDFQGASVTAGAQTMSDGIVNVTLDEEVQTGYTNEIVADDAVEVHNNDGSTTSESPSADVTFEIQLSEGINVVSIPAETGSVDLSELNLAEHGVDSVITYDNGDWSQFYDADTGEGSLETMTGGQGYIVLADHSTEIDVNVDNVPADGWAMSSESLEAGWNLVGAYQEGTQPVDQAISTLPSEADWSVQKGYSATQPSTMEPGAGYWVFTNDDDGVLAPVDYTGLQSDQPTIVSTNAHQDGEPTDELVVDGDSVNVSVEASDDTGISKVYVDGSPLGGASEVPLTDDNNDGVYDGTFSVDAATATASNGETTLDVAVIDASGNVQYGSDTVEYDADPLSTDISVTKNANDNIVLTVTSNEQLSTLEVTTGTNLNGPHSLSEFTEGGTGPYTYTLTTSVTGSAGTTYSATIGNAVDTNNTEDTDSGASESLALESGASTFTNPTVDPSSAQSGSSTDSQVLEFDVSPNTEWDDGDTDEVRITLPDEFVGEQTSPNSRVGTVQVTDGDNVDYSSGLVLGDDGDNVYDTIELSFSASANTAHVTVSSLSLDYPNVANGEFGTTYDSGSVANFDVGAKVNPSTGSTIQDDTVATLTVDDGAATAQSASYTDSDNDGTVDEMTVTFDEPVSAENTVDAADFTLNGGELTGSDDSTVAGTGSVSGLGTNSITVSLDTADADMPSGDTSLGAVSVSYSASSGSNTGGLVDEAGNVLTSDSVSDTSVTDSAAAQVLAAEKTATSTVELRFTEDVGTGNGDGTGVIDSTALSYDDGSTTEDSAESFGSGDVADNGETITITVSTGDVTQTDVDGDDAISIDSILNSAGADGSTISTQNVDIVDNEANA